MDSRAIGTAKTKLAKPPALMESKAVHPTAIEQINIETLLRPWLAAIAIDNVVFGPGVKLATVDRISKPIISSVDILEGSENQLYLGWWTWKFFPSIKAVN